MGVSTSKDCGCIAAVSKVAFSLWPKYQEETRLSVLDEDEIIPAGLLSEQEIQCLLNESHINHNKNYEPV